MILGLIHVKSFNPKFDFAKKIIRKKNLVLGEVLTQKPDEATITAETKYSTEFTDSKKKFGLSLKYNGSNSFLYVYGVKINQFKAKTLK